MIVILYVLLVYILFCKVWPYFLYPNYFKKSKIEDYDNIKKLASKLKNKNKIETLKNVSNYMNETYFSYERVFQIKSILTLFNIGDFDTKNILNKKQFLWCHNQNRLFKSILVNTDLFNEKEIKIEKRYFKSFFIHQWLSVNVGEKIIKIDPYYKIFEIKLTNR